MSARCPPSREPQPKERSLGYAKGPLISFLVNWNGFDSITAWVGQVAPDEPEAVSALWHMVIGTSPAEEWQSVFAGFDTFTRQPPA